jgi:hypothetical protein
VTTPITEQVPGLGETLQRELVSARERVTVLKRRRRELERELQIVAVAEQESRERLKALTAVAQHAAGSTAVKDADLAVTDDDVRVLAGGALRETLTRIALRRNAHGRPVHWRVWFGWLHEEGFEAAGKRAEATFQTQLGRSPLVRRADRDGVYVLDVELLARLRDDVLTLHQRLAELPPPGQLTLMGDARAVRRELQQRITRAERRLEEAWRLLTEELGADTTGERLTEAEQVTRLWQQRGQHAPSETPAAGE